MRHTVLYRAAVLVLTLMVASEGSRHAEGAMYHCVDEAGRKVLSDSPAQLSGCSAVDADTGTSHALPPKTTPPLGPSADTSEQVTPQPGETERAVAADPMLITLEHAGHLLIVEARLNDQRPARLILDTGASHTIVSHAVARDLGLVFESGGGAVTLKTAGGTVQAAMSHIQAVRVGEAEAFNIPVAVHDLPDAPAGIEGLLGMTFLNQFLMTLDTHNGALLLQRR